MKQLIRLHLLVLTTILTLIAATNAFAQYTLQVSHTEYIPLTNAVELPMRWADTTDPYTYYNPGKRSFTFFDTVFTVDSTNPIGVSKWGDLMLESENRGMIIDGFFTNMLDSIGPDSKVYAETDETKGEPIVKFEWRHVGFKGFPASIYLNCQIWLYQRSGLIETHFGTATIDCANGPDETRLAYAGLFLGSPDFGKIYKLFWLYGDPNAPSVTRGSFKTLNCFPDSGTVYTIAPQTLGVKEGQLDNRRVKSRLVHDRLLLDDRSEVTIYNLRGAIVAESSTPIQELDVAPLEPAPYFVVSHSLHQTSVQKIIKY